VHTRPQFDGDPEVFAELHRLLDAALPKAADSVVHKRITVLKHCWETIELFFAGQEEPSMAGRKRIAERIFERTCRTGTREDPSFFSFITMQTRRWLTNTGQWDDPPADELDLAQID